MPSITEGLGSCELFGISTNITQCNTESKERSKHSEYKATIVKLLYNTLKTISFYCRLCNKCVLRNKVPKDIVTEYCTKVFLDFI